MRYIIVPTFARTDDTIRFLASISKSIKKNYLILLIDDHPKKITFNQIHQSENIRILTSDKELWWVGSINHGIKTLLTEYALLDEDTVVFANNDIEIDIASYINLEHELKNNKKQIIHPRTFNNLNEEVSSGAKIVTYFPYISRHPKNFKKEKEIIDMGTARFLMMSGYVLKKVGLINQDLLQYGGDNDFTLSAKKFHNINTYILRDARCKLDDTNTGIKNHNIQSFKMLFRSFFSIKSPNNISYRFILFKKFYGKYLAFFITSSLSINTLIKYCIKR
jgi:GT2 family glycosyltransferase